MGCTFFPYYLQIVRNIALYLQIIILLLMKLFVKWHCCFIEHRFFIPLLLLVIYIWSVVIHLYYLFFIELSAGAKEEGITSNRVEWEDF